MIFLPLWLCWSRCCPDPNSLASAPPSCAAVMLPWLRKMGWKSVPMKMWWLWWRWLQRWMSWFHPWGELLYQADHLTTSATFPQGATCQVRKARAVEKMCVRVCVCMCVCLRALPWARLCWAETFVLLLTLWIKVRLYFLIYTGLHVYLV